MKIKKTTKYGKKQYSGKPTDTSYFDQYDAPIAEELPVRIPPGEYDASCYDTEKGISWGGHESIYIKFRIYCGEFDGTELFMACTYHPKSEITYRHKYYQQYSMANGGPPQKGQRLSPSIFKNKMYRVLVRDTKRKFLNGQLMPAFHQYSVVDTILETLSGKPMI